jgi:hypothetical protein
MAGSGILTREAAVAVAVQLNSLLQTIREYEDKEIEGNTVVIQKV